MHTQQQQPHHHTQQQQQPHHTQQQQEPTWDILACSTMPGQPSVMHSTTWRLFFSTQSFSSRSIFSHLAQPQVHSQPRLAAFTTQPSGPR